MLPKGIMFDLDDTILAYSPVGPTTWRKVCAEYAELDERLSADALVEGIGRISRWYWSDATRHRIGRLDLHKARREIVERVFRELDIQRFHLAHSIADAFSDQREEAVHLFDGAVETLQYLNHQGVSLALITNGAEDKQNRKIERFRLAPFFSTIMIEGAVGVGKPEEAVYVCALEALDLHPHEVWFVGDNLEWDVAAPQRLGIYGIWHDYDRRGLPDPPPTVPDRIIHSIAELCSH